MQKAKILTSLMLAVSALVPLASHAQDHDRDHDRRWDRDRHEERVDMDRRADREMAHRWNRGERIPPEYRDRQYIVEDWRDHHLAPPPRGAHWVGVNGGYYLVQPSGIVLNVNIGG